MASYRLLLLYHICLVPPPANDSWRWRSLAMAGQWLATLLLVVATAAAGWRLGSLAIAGWLWAGDR